MSKNDLESKMDNTHSKKKKRLSVNLLKTISF